MHSRSENPHNFHDSLHDLRNGHIDDMLQDSSRLTLCRRHLDHFKTLLMVKRQSDPRLVDGCAHEAHTESPPRCLSKSVAPPPRRFAPRPAVTERRYCYCFVTSTISSSIRSKTLTWICGSSTFTTSSSKSAWRTPCSCRSPPSGCVTPCSSNLRLGALLPSSAPQPAAKAQNASSPRLNEASLYKKPQTRGEASEKTRKFVNANPSKPSSISGWTSSFPAGACSQYPRVKNKTQSPRKTLNHITFHISSFHWLSTDI